MMMKVIMAENNDISTAMDDNDTENDNDNDNLLRKLYKKIEMIYT